MALDIYSSVCEASEMRHLLSQIIKAIELGANAAGRWAIYIVLAPFAFAGLSCIIPCCVYRYCKHPELSLGQAFRWACTSEEQYHLMDDKPNYDLLWNWALPPFSMDEYLATKKIIEAEQCGTDAPNTET